MKRINRNVKIYKGYAIRLHNNEFMASAMSGTGFETAKTLKELLVKIDSQKAIKGQ